MAGFLDKNNRIIDMILTNTGRDLLSKGELRFTYWAVFDTEVDYSPVLMNSSSLSSMQMTSSINEQVEDTLVQEAKSGYKKYNLNCEDFVNVKNPLFSIPLGQKILPSMTASHTAEVDISVKQQKIIEMQIRKDMFGNTIEQLGPFDRGILRFDGSSVTIDFNHTAFPKDYKFDGVCLTVFKSGSDGIVPVIDKRDLNNNITFLNDLCLDIIGDKNSGS